MTSGATSGITYGWGDYRLDGGGTWLAKSGGYLDVSRRTLAYIVHLIEQRHRVVDHAELFRVLWGHESVTHHQLIQVVVAARRAVGDDGQSQQWIRTFPGLGYRWVGEVFVVDGTEGADAQIDPAPLQPPRDSTSVPASIVADAVLPAPEHPRAVTAQTRTRRHVRDALALACCIVLLALLFGPVLRSPRIRDVDVAMVDRQAATPADPVFDPLWDALWRGAYPRVSEALAALPPHLSASHQAKLLEIHLDIEQAAFENASMKLAVLRERSEATGDVLWQARALSTTAWLNGAQGKAEVDVLLPAKSAVLLLESSETVVPPSVMGEALLVRGYGYMKALDYDQAIRDLEHARVLLTAGGNMYAAMDAADTLGRVYMRTGRYTRALELFETVANHAQTAGFRVQEIYARNAATKIDIELLRWRQALASSERSMRLLSSVPQSERRTRVLLLRARWPASAACARPMH